MKINATRASCLVGRSEKAIRKWCREGFIPAKKVSRPGRPEEWEIELDALYTATLGLVDGETLRIMRAWLDLQLRGLGGSPGGTGGAIGAPPSTSPGGYGEIADTSPPPSGGIPGTFRSATEAARWLLTHGLHSVNTVRHWPGWPPSSLDPASVLTFALAIYNPRDWRVTWRLHECEVAGCVCHQLL